MPTIPNGYFSSNYRLKLGNGDLQPNLLRVGSSKIKNLVMTDYSGNPFFIYHPEAIDWVNRVQSNGGNVGFMTFDAVNQFCYSIDYAGLRNKFSRLNLMCGNDLNSCLVPLYISSSFNGDVEGFDTDTNYNFVSGDYAETGSGGGLNAGGGNGKYLDTGLVVNNSSSISPNDNHMSAYIADRSNLFDMGMVLDFWACDYGQNLYLNINTAGNNSYYSIYEYPDFPLYTNPNFWGVGFTATTDLGLFLGTFKIDDTNSSSNGYRNGVSDNDGTNFGGTITPSNWASYTYSLRIFDAYWNGCGTTGYGYGFISSYSIGKSMSSSQQSDFYDILQTFQTALGRNK
jgi:hypothetical protein